MDNYTLPRLPSSLQFLMSEYTGLNFLPLLYAELLFQLSEPYGSVSEELSMIHEEIAELIYELVSPF